VACRRKWHPKDFFWERLPMACSNYKKNLIIYQPRKVLILDEAINITIKYKKIAEWMVIAKE
jgi:hypothetical protein